MVKIPGKLYDLVGNQENYNEKLSSYRPFIYSQKKAMLIKLYLLNQWPLNEFNIRLQVVELQLATLLGQKFETYIDKTTA